MEPNRNRNRTGARAISFLELKLWSTSWKYIKSWFPGQKQPGLKSQSKSALNSAVSEISKISALISAVSEWVKKTSADQRCSALVFSESALFSAGSKRSEKPTKMLRVSSKRYWDHEKHVLLECTSYEKNHSGEILVKIRIDTPTSSSCFLVARAL